MVVNDIIVLGAKPLFLLDYIASGELQPGVIEDLITGILEGCRQSDCQLLGGETAELAGMYARGHYDLAAFAVGCVERKKIVDGKRIRPGDVVIGLESTGPHSNGYTLARAVFDRLKLNPRKKIAELSGKTANEALLTPTRIYVPLILDLIKRFDIRGMANITGGGLPGNLNRALPADCDAEIDTTSWERRRSSISCSRTARSKRPRCSARSTWGSVTPSWRRKTNWTKSCAAATRWASPPTRSAASSGKSPGAIGVVGSPGLNLGHPLFTHRSF
jgi:phosphoribosylaminoimidazole synthetase